MRKLKEGERGKALSWTGNKPSTDSISSTQPNGLGSELPLPTQIAQPRLTGSTYPGLVDPAWAGIYLTHRWGPNRCYRCGPERTWEQWQLRVAPLSPNLRFPSLRPGHWMQFNVIQRTPTILQAKPLTLVDGQTGRN